MFKSTLSQTSDLLNKLIPCRLIGRTPDFESGNKGSKPFEGTIDQAIKLEPNSTYVIETEGHLSQRIKNRLTEEFEEYTKDLNIKFLLLDAGMKIAKEQQSLS